MRLFKLCAENYGCLPLNLTISIDNEIAYYAQYLLNLAKQLSITNETMRNFTLNYIQLATLHIH